ncbi:acyl-CoA-binding domain-containing protein 5 isoform X2 [Spea bombifrons]|uniref:acyl-CoA-binding domain-containing protein 5 isoform X2 n=1 Tax=Spea bombifrons TaxID=233779 RepID=UPI00234BDC44|nr:acyl-CoA-binding domain-containing protein 5 isoform X2 [Spea bombifrons]
MADTKSLHQTRFEAAVSVIQSLPKNGSFQPSNEMMLKFYSFYKQATQGPCNIPKPAFWDPVGRYKWDSWSSLGDMSKEDAMIAYVDEMKKILETMPMTEKVEELLRVIGPFYEMVEDQKHGLGSVVTSDLSNVLTSTPNCKAINGKTESSDSGAESEEEEPTQHKNGEAEESNDEEESEQEEKNVEQDSDPQSPPKTTVGPDVKVDHINSIPEIGNHISDKSSLNKAIGEENTNEDKLITEDAVNALERDRDYDGTDDIAAMQHLTSDSDSEVFCDSMEQFGQEEVDHSALLQDVLLINDPMKTADGGEDKDGGESVRPSGHLPQRDRSGHKSEYVGSRRGRVGRMHTVGEGSRGGQMGSSGDEEHWKSLNSSLNEQIAVILTRLQEDMQNVIHRLHALENLTASQARSLALESNYKQAVNKSPSWWPFDLSPGNFAFAIVWPFVAHWLIHVYLQRKRRKPT